jgi:thioredoxin-related protein
MKRSILTISLLFSALTLMAAQVEWFTDGGTAQTKAKNEKKFLLADFTGSDWCGWCMKLKSEVFDKSEFADYANRKLVMVEVDFPRHKPQDPHQKQLNEDLAKKLNVTGFPTVFILDAAGHPLGKLGYMEGGPKAFIAEVERIIGNASNNPAPVEDSEPEAPRKPVTFVPIAPTAQNRYSELALKAVSGAKDRRIALINNATFEVGEKAMVKVQNDRIEVTCKEIRDDSVLVLVDGKSVELKMAKR